MPASAFGTVEALGTNVRVKAGLNRAIYWRRPSGEDANTVLQDERAAPLHPPCGRLRAPLRRCNVLATATTIAPFHGTIPSNSPSRVRAPFRHDHRALWSCSKRRRHRALPPRHCASSVPVCNTFRCARVGVGAANRQAKGSRTDTIEAGRGNSMSGVLVNIGRYRPRPSAAKSILMRFRRSSEMAKVTKSCE